MASIEQIVPHIVTIHDLDPATDSPSTGEAPIAMALGGWTIRMAARCVVVDSHTGRIALQGLDTENVTKIPGGGLRYDSIDSSRRGESFRTGLVREVAEEIGVAIGNADLRPLGMVTEYRSEWRLQQISYCYVGHTNARDTHTEPTEEGSRLVWADTPSHAIDLVKSNGSDTYDKRFMKIRDIATLEYYRAHATEL